MWGRPRVRSAGSKPFEPPPLRARPLRPQPFAAGTVPTHRTEGLEGHGVGRGNILVFLSGNTKEMALRATEHPRSDPGGEWGLRTARFSHPLCCLLGIHDHWGTGAGISY